MPAVLQLSLLGAPAAEVDGEPLAVDTRKAIALLAYLAVEGGGHTRDSLATMLWPDYDGDRARAALRRTLSTLRAALGGRWVEAQRDTVWLDREGVQSDVDEARRLTEEGRFEQAAALHRGPFLAGFGLRDSTTFDSWQTFTAGTFTRELATVLDRAADERAGRGEWAPAIEHARRRLALDPVNEPAHRRLIALYAESGERSAAVSQYRDCVRTLYRELGVAPIESTTALYRSILEGSSTEPAEVAGPPSGHPEHSLVGREDEWRALRDAYGSVAKDGVLVAIEGETGIGKTRLGEELLAWAREAGAVGISVRCFEPEAGLAFGTAIGLVRAALEEGDRGRVDPATAAEAARIVPELGTPPTPSLDDPGAQARFLDGLARTVLAATAGEHAPVVFVDDLHWADTASLEALAYLARRLRGSPLLLAVTWRPEETPPGHPARALLADAARAGLGRTIAPSRLGSDEVAELAAAAGAPAELAGRLFEETQGIPFFVVEYLDALADESADWPVPPAVRDVLEARIATSGELAAQVLAAGAVIGRSFALETARDVSGRGEEEAVEALDELTARGLLAESDGAYDFRHEQTRRVAYERTSLGRRRLLHGRAGDALAARADADTQAGSIAQHLRLAGREPEAAEWHRVAGERARGLYANAEALAHFGAALDLGHAEPAGIHEQAGDLRTLAGDYAGALASYESAAALAPPEHLGELEHRIGLVHHRRGDWALAESSFERALAAVPGDEHGERARILADRSLNSHRAGRDADALELAEQALALAADAGDGRALAQAHNILGILATGRGDPGEARRQLEKSLALSPADDPAARAAALNNLALAYRAEGELDRALTLTEEALLLCVKVGDRHREAALANNAADLLHAAGRRDESIERLRQAVAIFAEIGAQDGMELEIWKLVEW
jgi:DNA-binding SARP family transcriptional activator/tetratricopeptide (TPR) repeat protein